MRLDVVPVESRGITRSRDIEQCRVDIDQVRRVAEYRTVGNETILVIVEPESDKLFSYTGDYKITSVIAANILSETMEIELTDRILPDVFELSQNFPNPFNPNTQIQFTLGKDELVNLDIFDIQGRLVKSLISNSYYPSGYHNIIWNGKKLLKIALYNRKIAGKYYKASLYNSAIRNIIESQSQDGFGKI